MGRILAAAVLVAAVVAATLSTGATAHPERDSFYPNFDRSSLRFTPAFGKVPRVRPIFRRRGGRRLVVCKSDSRRRIKRYKGSRRMKRLRLANLRLLKKCRYRHIQAAVNAARNGQRIAVLPGVYREQPSRRSANPDPRCNGLWKQASTENQTVPRGLLQTELIVGSYEYHRRCPNSQNLIAVIGDGPDPDRRCDDKCNIQITGTGRRPGAVLISGRRLKQNVIKGDRADGLSLRNFTVQYSDFNNIYVHETNGFAVRDVVTRYSREYGFLSFTSDNGLIDNVEALGSGDSGIYPGAGPEGHCMRYGIEIRNSNSHHNNIGYSGTAGNGVWAHDNRFHHNSTGMTTDSFAGNHPGMPQDCAKWERNRVYSNNLNLWSHERDEYCDPKNRPLPQRDPKIVCPTFQNPVGTGILIGGGNGNIVRNNFVYDNWRDGVKLFWVPRELRGQDPTGQSVNTSNQFDTSLDNKFTDNFMSVRPGGARDPNGTDFWWDGEGRGNCWERNRTAAGARITSNVVGDLPGCPGSRSIQPGNSLEQASQVACALWNPYDPMLRDPPGCDWFEVPPEPR